MRDFLILATPLFFRCAFHKFVVVEYAKDRKRNAARAKGCAHGEREAHGRAWSSGDRERQYRRLVAHSLDWSAEIT